MPAVGTGDAPQEMSPQAALLPLHSSPKPSDRLPKSYPTHLQKSLLQQACALLLTHANSPTTLVVFHPSSPTGCEAATRDQGTADTSLEAVDETHQRRRWAGETKRLMSVQEKH